MHTRTPQLALVLATAVLFAATARATTTDPLPSWNAGDTKSRIVAFVEAITDPDGPKFVAVEERVAVFDNDGTLWAEQPVYFQFLYAMDRLAELATKDPKLLSSDVLKAAAKRDTAGAMAGGEAGLVEIVTTSHSGTTVAEFQRSVGRWLADTRHPTLKRPYVELVYQPMLELLQYLRDAGFATYIASGGGIHFIRVFAEGVYGIPPEQVIGSVGGSSYQVRDGEPVIVKEPSIAFVDDKAGKPVAIDRNIGRRPIFAAGNSDGDFEMIEWTTAGDGARFGLIVHHTDAEREWSYDRDSHVGKLDRALTEGPKRGWVIVDMKRDWSSVFPEAK